MIYFIVNDNSAGRLAVNVQPDRSGLSQIGVLIDQTVPANSPETSMDQKKLRGWAEKYQLPFSYGRVTTGALLAGDDSARFGWNLKAGDVVVGTVAEVYAAGGTGAIGLCLSAEEFVDIMETGRLPEHGEMNDTQIQYKKMTIEGCLLPEASIRDAARAAISQLNEVGNKKHTILLAGGPAMKTFSREEKAVFCQLLAHSGFLSVTAYEENSGTREIEELWNTAKSSGILELDTVKGCDDGVNQNRFNIKNSVKQKIAGVYLGGMGGFLPDICFAARMLEGKHIAEGVRFLISPASAEIYCEAADAGYFTTIMEAGGMILNQCASPAVQGRIGENEIMVSNDCHGETGLAGPESSRIILASTQTAVNCALTGVFINTGEEGPNGTCI